MLTTTEYAYSLNQESYAGAFASRDEALAEGRSVAGDTAPVWTGVVVRPGPARFAPDAEDAMERAAERAWDEVGEWAEYWMPDRPRIRRDETVSSPAFQERQAEYQRTVNALQTRLTAVWCEWLQEQCLEPTFFTVEQIERHAPDNVTT